MRNLSQLSTIALYRLASVADFCARWSWLIVLLALLAAGMAATYTVANFAVNTSTKGMINSDLDFRKRFDALAAEFPHIEDSFVAVVEADTPDAAKKAAVAFASSLESRSDTFTNVYAPAAESFFEDNGLLYLTSKEVEDAADRLTKTAPLLNGLSRDATLRGLARFFSDRRLARADKGSLEQLVPFLNALARVADDRAEGKEGFLAWNALLEEDGIGNTSKRQFVFMNPVLDFSRLEPAQTALDSAKDIARVMQGLIGEGTSIRITGDAALRAEELGSVTNGATFAGILSFVLASFIIVIGLRSWRLVVSAIFSLLVGLFFTACFATVAIGYLNIISIAFAVLFIGLGIDFAIHFALRYQEEANKGIGNRLAIYNTVQGIGGALAICTGTTALAFFAFSPTSFVGMSQLGIISGTGMFISFFTTFTVMPAMLTLVAGRSKRVPRKKAPAWGMSAYIRHGVSGLVIGLGLAALFLAPEVKFDGDPLNLKDPATESVQAFNDLVDNEDDTPYAAQMLVTSRAEIEALKERVAEVEGVGEVVSIFSFVPDRQGHKRTVLKTAADKMPTKVSEGRRAPSDAQRLSALKQLRTGLGRLGDADVPDNVVAAAKRAEAALGRFETTKDEDAEAFGGLETGLFERLKPALDDINKTLKVAHVELENLPEDLRRRYIAPDGRYLVEIYPDKPVKGDKGMRAFVKIIDDALDESTGNVEQIIKSADVVSLAMIAATALAGGLITVVLMIGFGRALDVLLVLFPIALAGSLTIGAMVALDIPFNFANVIVLPLLIGLGVDSGIHLVSRAREDGARVKLLATSTPKAVALSALTTIGSFGSLSLSSHLGMASMGLLLTVSVVMTMVCTLIVLPSILDLALRRN